MSHIKLIQRIRSIEKLLGISFDPDNAENEKDLHRIEVDGRLDTLEKNS